MFSSVMQSIENVHLSLNIEFNKNVHPRKKKAANKENYRILKKLLTILTFVRSNLFKTQKDSFLWTSKHA